MAKTIKKSGITGEPLNLDIIVDREGTIDNSADSEQINVDYIHELLGSEPTTYVPLVDEYTSQIQLHQVSYYAEELLVALEGIFIGGHASQIRDQLYVALNNYKNGKQDEL